MVMNRENVANSVVMIQPSLISYAFNSGAEPALLDVASIAADRILLLDSYFTVVVFHGSTILALLLSGVKLATKTSLNIRFLHSCCKTERERGDEGV
ncbi:putative protein transport protein Sec23 [Helianthus annuus]|nr:putative protein transport protein Sec23 [Helianthus annuus]